MTAATSPPYSPTQIATGLFRSARPTAADIAGFVLPLRTIIDLEPTTENLVPGEVHIPMSSWTPPKLADVQKAAAIMANEEIRPTLVHCKQGVDRTGIVCAYFRVRYDDWFPDDAYNEMLAMGYHWLRYGVLGWSRAAREMLGEAFVDRVRANVSDPRKPSDSRSRLLT